MPLGADARLKFIGYRLDNSSGTPVPAERGRKWMDATSDRFANRCLPLLMANQAGWHILSEHTLEAVWNGGPTKADSSVRVLSGPGNCPATSHFGAGIITWHIPYLFRTPPGYNLLVRGPSNLPKDGVSPLEGMVETDWSVATFTMNWKITRAHHPVLFEEGEPICCVLPQRRGELESFTPILIDLERDRSLADRFRVWAESRRIFLGKLKTATTAASDRWQKHYFQGRSPAGDSFGNHQTKLKIRAFKVNPEIPDSDPAPTDSELPPSCGSAEPKCG